VVILISRKQHRTLNKTPPVAKSFPDSAAGIKTIDTAMTKTLR